MEHTEGKLCSCGNPQSYPIPHEHDQTEREKAIIKHFRNSHDDLLAACERIREKADTALQERGITKESGIKHGETLNTICLIAEDAIAAAQIAPNGKTG